jgi:hypothetical protein
VLVFITPAAWTNKPGGLGSKHTGVFVKTTQTAKGGEKRMIITSLVANAAGCDRTFTRVIPVFPFRNNGTKVAFDMISLLVYIP